VLMQTRRSGGIKLAQTAAGIGTEIQLAGGAEPPSTPRWVPLLLRSGEHPATELLRAGRRMLHK